MKKTLIIFLLAVVFATAAMAISLEAGLTYMQPAPLDTLVDRLKDKDLSVFLDSHEVSLSARMNDSYLDAGIDAGVVLFKTEAPSEMESLESLEGVETGGKLKIVPFARAFVGMKIRLFEYFAISGDIGYQMKFPGDKTFDGTLFWRFGGNAILGPVSAELFTIIPVPTDSGFAGIFNLGTAAHDARFGLSVSYMF